MKILTTSLIAFALSLQVFASENVQLKIVADKESGYLPLKVKFTSNDENSDASYKWIFGNGNTSTLKTPSTTFVNPGTYQVKLFVTTETQTDSTTLNINVLANPELINYLFKARANNE